ncbi:MAG: Hsp20/alpha crystallin family protein [Desulfobacterales bacterium]|jgi:HSP20 family protein
MNIKKWIPWNWFKKEEEDAGRAVPVHHAPSRTHGGTLATPLMQFHQDVDRLFDRALRGFGLAPLAFERPPMPSLSGDLLRPTLDLGATDEEYTIAMEIPGVNAKDVQLEMVDDTLTISGEKRQTKEAKEKNFYRRERSYGSFQRTLSLPEDADQDSVKATFENGILTVRMPRKALPKSDVKQIPVTSA